jgi:hypothetical protein
VGWGKEWVDGLRVMGIAYFLWPLCVFGCISAVVVHGACVRDFPGDRVV